MQFQTAKVYQLTGASPQGQPQARSAVAITAGASAGAGTTGTSSGASAGKKDATTQSRTGYEKGLASFSIIKGGLMYEAALGGAKFKYKPL